MKTDKNILFPKKGHIMLFKIVLWISLGFLFLEVSILIPTNYQNTYKEYIIFLFLAIIVNIHTSWLYPKFAKKKRWKYALVLSSSIFICIIFEFALFFKEFSSIIHSLGNANKIYFVIVMYIFIRNLALFIFFLWVESFHQLILLYVQKEKVYQEKMALFIEKQEFEKKFSRKKLLSHYFFNILEHLYVNSLTQQGNGELLDKVKFSLYYFLVDAEKEIIELDKELEFYKYYIDLEEFRCRKKVSVNFNVIGNTENYTLIPLLFEPLIGNAMKHTQSGGCGWIDIKVDATNFPVLNFHCKNNYCYRSSNIVSSENGLKILKQRLELCYKNNHELIIEQSDDFYEVLLSIMVK
jgi:LytS/YehU family sensor histidine kinase